MTPRQKAIRTALQILGGAVVLAGPLVAALPIAATTMAVVVAVLVFAGGLVALVQNALEENGVLPRLFDPSRRAVPATRRSSTATQIGGAGQVDGSAIMAELSRVDRARRQR